MRLQKFRIQHCFGFQDSEEINFSDKGNLTYLLGRNSSGKTAVLTALDAMESTEAPNTYARFENYETLASARSSAPLTARYQAEPEDKRIFSADKLLPLVTQAFGNTGLKIKHENEGYRAHAGNARRSNVETVLNGILEIYTELIDRIYFDDQLTIQRFADGSYAFFADGDTEATQQDRVAEVDKLIRTNLGDPPKVQNAQNQVQIQLNAQRIESLVYRLVTEIVDFTQKFGVEDNLPREIGQQHLDAPDNTLVESFVSILGEPRLRKLLRATRNSTIEGLERELNSDLDQLCAEINSGVSEGIQDEGFVSMSLRKQRETIKLEVRVDAGPSYFEHLSDATKFLIAFNLIRKDRERKNYLNNVLIFDEPNRGFHPSAWPDPLNSVQLR